MSRPRSGSPEPLERSPRHQARDAPDRQREQEDRHVGVHHRHRPPESTGEPHRHSLTFQSLATRSSASSEWR